MIDKPYKTAFLTPLALDLLCLVKKLTVIGIIGKTHGVSRAAKPDKKAMKNIPQSPRLVVPSSAFVVTLSAAF